MSPDDVAYLFAPRSLERQVFAEVLKRRRVIFKDLLQRFSDNDPNTSHLRERIKSALFSLKEADLVDQSTAPLEDFNTWFVTAGGFDAERRIR
jgi:hypothetical protein